MGAEHGGIPINHMFVVVRTELSNRGPTSWQIFSVSLRESKNAAGAPKSP